MTSSPIEPPSDSVPIATAFVIDAARMVLADHDVGADPTAALEMLRRALAQLDRAEANRG